MRKEVHEVKARLADEAQQRREVARGGRADEKAAYARVTELTLRDEAEAALRRRWRSAAQAVRLRRRQLETRPRRRAWRWR